MANPVKIKVIVEMITKYGESTYEVKFRPEGRVPRFKAGQFLHLTVDEYDPAGGFGRSLEFSRSPHVMRQTTL